MRKRLILASLMACLCFGAQAQEKKAEEPKGKAIVQVFGSFNTGFGAENDSRGFELERSYLGYEYNLGGGLSVKSVMDIGKSSDVSDNQRLAYVKNAMITWKKDNFTFNGGLISNIQFNFQEKFWGYRYVAKDFQDMYKFGNSADLGISASYKFNDYVSADAIIVNGEGYKKLQKKDGLLYGAGVTLTPIKGLSVRFYGSVNEAADKSKENTSNFAAFVGYKGDGFSIGAEYNKMENASNKQTASIHITEEESIEKEIKTMPNYFADYDTSVNFITQEELDRDHKGLPHGGVVIRTGKTGFELENSQTIEYSLKLDSNPEFTASAIVAYTGAMLKMRERGEIGCKTVFDIAPCDLSTISREDMLSHML